MDRLDSEKEEQSAKRREKELEAEDHTLVLTEPVPEDRMVPSDQDDEQKGQSLLPTIIMVIGAIILVILLVLLARWIYHSVHSGGSPASGTASQPSQRSNSNSASNQSNKPGANQKPGSSGSSNPGNSSSVSNSQNQTKTLTNTGPGNVAAVFTSSTLAAAGLHYIISLRRSNKPGD